VAIRVIVADDSPFLCGLVSAKLKEAEGFDVVACVNEGKAVLPKIREHRPDAISLGLNFPDADGLDVLAQIMREHPLPVVVLTGTGGRFAFRVARAMDLGAADYVLKFIPGKRTAPTELTASIVRKLRAAASTKVMRLRPSPEPVGTKASRDLVVIGASTGGPTALAELLRQLSADFPAAVLVVQHMPAKFTKTFAERLNKLCALPVSEARRGDVLSPGSIKLAPGGFHLSVEAGGRLRLHPVDSQPGNCPSVDLAMESAAKVFESRMAGVLLTGMGSDGTAGLAAIRRSGGSTYVQDLESCAVPGMPGAALRKGLADKIARPDELGRLLKLDI
jgi:two-component system, chemotaxis family, protein-glutamate methylesterase/glutaminase